MKSPRIIFFPVRHSQEKVKHLAETARFHFHRKEHFAIFAEDEKAVHFIDELLWKFPQTSFLPHTATEESSDWIAITQLKKNPNNARFAFNLCPTPLLIEGPFQIIYEFEDLTSPSKKNLSSLRFDAYKKGGFIIESR